MFGHSELSRADREFLAIVVSRTALPDSLTTPFAGSFFFAAVSRATRL